MAEESFYASFGLRSAAGLRVLAVAPGGAAAAAGLKPDDEIVAVGTSPVRSLGDLRLALDRYGAGAPVELGVRRGGQERTLTVLPGRSTSRQPGLLAGQPRTTAQGSF